MDDKKEPGIIIDSPLSDNAHNDARHRLDSTREGHHRRNEFGSRMLMSIMVALILVVLMPDDVQSWSTIPKILVYFVAGIFSFVSGTLINDFFAIDYE